MSGCNGNHPLRFFPTAGNYLEVETFLDKHIGHEGLGESIYAADLSKVGGLGCPDCAKKKASPLFQSFAKAAKESIFQNAGSCRSIHKRIARLKERGVTVIPGLDATKIQQHPETRGKRFRKIHCICPHDRSSYHQQTLPKLIEDLLLAFKTLQEEKDTIYVVLAQPDGKEAFYQGVIYNIVRAAKAAGYIFKTKRHFGSGRYPGYVHAKTGGGGSAAGAAKLREFVFVKGSSTNAKTCHIARRTFKDFEEREFYVASTDYESSDCDDQEELEKAIGRKRVFRGEASGTTPKTAGKRRMLEKENENDPNFLEIIGEALIPGYKEEKWTERVIDHLGYEKTFSQVSIKEKEEPKRREIIKTCFKAFLFGEIDDEYTLNIFEILKGNTLINIDEENMPPQNRVEHIKSLINFVRKKFEQQVPF